MLPVILAIQFEQVEAIQEHFVVTPKDVQGLSTMGPGTLG
jgi:hypothetical protein